MLCCSLNIWAAKSSGTPMLVLQPDGKSVTIQLLGDEDFSWYQTTDGVLLVRKKSAYYVAKVNNGELVSTGVLAHDPSDRSKKEKKLIDAQNKSSFFMQADNSVKAKRKAVAKLNKKNFCPHMGEIHIPIILMNYTDKRFVLGDGDKEKLYEVFEEYFNGEKRTPYTSETRFQGYGSVRQYFIDASNGKFTPVFDLYGPYETANTHDYYGRANGNTSALLKEAVACADADIDFSKYDSNNDGNVDLVYVLYAGTGANLSGNRYDVWPACWYNRTIKTNENKTVNVIGVANELAASSYLGEPVRAGIGVFCHEMSHGLGLPDLYWTLGYKPTDADGNVDFDNCGPEDWDLMDGGENLFNGMWPCQYTTWEREYLGWEDAEEITDAQNITLAPRNKGGKAYRITNPADPYEYYTIEHSGYDEWNYYLNRQYGNGMLIMHITSSSDGFDMNPNNTYGHPNITLLPADGRILAYYTYTENPSITQGDYKNSLRGDIYPGLDEVTSVENFKNYSGSDMVKDFPITNIVQNDDQTVSFRFMGGEYHIEDATPLVDVPTGQYGKITYTRNFKNTAWQPLYVPFSMSYDDWCDDFDVAKLVEGVDVYDENGKITKFNVKYSTIKSGELTPNTPYVIKAKKEGVKTITVRDAFLHETECNTQEIESEKTRFKIVGTYTEIGAKELQANNFYVMGGGKIGYASNTTSLKPMRFYFTFTPKESQNASKDIPSFVLIDDEDTVTGINGITEQKNSESQNNVIYDVNGRKVSGSTLQHGIYINNGKKFVK